ncbi:MAG: HAD family hydrolase [Actinobacteria bacterium]|nr:HAD family hydrolase [Actinomycetota bacterium]
MKPFLLFDLYGTLIDIEVDEENESVFKFITKWLNAQGFKITPKKLAFLYKSCIENSRKLKKDRINEYEITSIFYNVIKSINPTKRPKRLSECAARIFRIMTTRYINLFDETLELLKRAKKQGIEVGIIANAQRFNAEVEMEMFNINKYVDYCVFSSDVGARMPDPSIFLKAKEDFCCDAGDIYFITSHSKNNVESFNKFGIETIKVIPNKGFDYKNKILSADEVLELITGKD